MRDYFEAEMRLLHEAAQEFAEAHPEQARMLNMLELNDRDPYIERLLEGVAFLTANIRQRIEGAEMALSEQLLAQICPQQLRPYPSTLIMQFALDVHRQTPCLLAPGAQVASAPVGEGTPAACRFSTLSELMIRPLRIERALAEARSGGVTLLQLDFRVEAALALTDLELGSIPLHLCGPRVMALALYLGLCQGIRSIRVRYEADGEEQVRELGGQELLEPMYLSPGSRPEQEGHPGFDLLHDYFCFRDKFLFVDLQGLDTVEWPPDCGQFRLELEMAAQLPPGHPFSEENVRMHCVPAVNLYAADADPIDLNHRTAEYRVVADASRRQEVHVHAVHAVSGRALSNGKEHPYQPLHALHGKGGGERYFHTFRRDNGVGVPLTYLMVGGDHELEPETLSCRITATNGHLPRRYLHENQIDRPVSGVPASIGFTNISRPGPFLEPPPGKEYPRRLHALLIHSASSIARPGMLQELLRLFEWTGKPENQRRIQGIGDVQTRTVNRIISGVLHRGVEVSVVVDEEYFLSVADVYLLGQVLHHFLALSANLNEFVQTRLVCRPSYEEFLWAPRPGRNSPL